MPDTTYRTGFAGSNPCHGRVIKSLPTTGYDRAGSADAAADVVGFGYSNASAAGNLRTVNIGQVWAVEVDPMSAPITATGVQLMVTAEGLVFAKGMSDTGLCMGASAAPPLGVPAKHASQTFVESGRRYCWALCQPVDVT